MGNAEAGLLACSGRVAFPFLLLSGESSLLKQWPVMTRRLVKRTVAGTAPEFNRIPFSASPPNRGPATSTGAKVMQSPQLPTVA